MAQKYGQPSLPNKIPATEMDAILVEMNKVYRSTMQELEKLVLTPEVHSLDKLTERYIDIKMLV